MAGLADARARCRLGGIRFALTKSKLRLAQASMAMRDTKVSELCAEIGVTRATLYRYVCPEGRIRPHGEKLLNSLT
jgi:AcrR family transcriptional regulator